MILQEALEVLQEMNNLRKTSHLYNRSLFDDVPPSHLLDSLKRRIELAAPGVAIWWLEEEQTYALIPPEQH